MIQNRADRWRPGLSAAYGAVLDLRHIGRPAAIQKIGGDQENSRVPPKAGALIVPQIEIYQHLDFGGANEITSLNYYYVGDWWNDQISSIVVISGTWRFYEHWHYEGNYWDLGPGCYRSVVEAGIPDDTISSFQCIAL